ncbi:hypothetical protein Xmau_04089 [Xenorhabdus mauleonii]|uniref:Uncharacterized protein n=1 Tax=Xenorhabdus mauleonii TaxID=351675 RepID=A0A1I3VYA3_9GAMM|nr:hypothetical protein [Xenorhabdus mauleonii]PHM36939.1 hypothetical protein Xmau_04089 [Xenorhabdus mauleonii]SFJ99327.1 hypothetical protein SAMN05421680_1235 [Xenorhabdus mauleonii]
MISQKKEYGIGINRYILPKYGKEFLDNTDESHKIDEYVAKHKPDFSPLAYDDLINLTSQIRAVLNSAG